MTDEIRREPFYIIEHPISSYSGKRYAIALDDDGTVMLWSYRSDVALRFDSWKQAREIASVSLAGSEDHPLRPARVALAPESR